MININSAVTSSADPILIIENYSSWKKLLQVTAYVFRFMHRLCKPTHQMNKDNHFNKLSKEEIGVAETYWLRYTQKELDCEINETKRLVPFTDDLGIKQITVYLTMIENIRFYYRSQVGSLI